MARSRFLPTLSLALVCGGAVWLWLEHELPRTGDELAEVFTLKRPPKRIPVGATSETRFQAPLAAIRRNAGVNGTRLARDRRAAGVCHVCGKKPRPGSTVLKTQDGTRWHRTCNAGPTCGITGLPIPTGVATVEVEGEVFEANAYDEADRCLASGLPLTNHGEFLVNPRTGTKILASYKEQARSCVSCRDLLLSGWTVGGVGFSCDACVDSFKRDVQTNMTQLVAEVAAFLREEGLTPPEVEVFFASNEDGVSAIERGHCETTVTHTVGRKTYHHRILILSHLDRDLTLTVLSHEMAHAVVARAESNLEGSDEEGFCELVAWRFARSRKLPARITTGIEENQVESYREGFLRQRAKGKGLREILLAR